MVYKTVGDFGSDAQFIKLLEKIKEYFYFVYTDGILYTALINYTNKDRAFELLKRNLKPARNFYTQEIHESNLSKEGQFYLEWCRDNLVRLDRQRYEIENQKKLKLAMQAIDIFEESMKRSQMEADKKTKGKEDENV